MNMSDSVVYQKNIPLYGSYDVCVLGGGPAGVCAAIEAARDGAQVVLCEANGMLGGMATSALVGPFMTSYDREGKAPVIGGIFNEIVENMAAISGAFPPAQVEAPTVFTSHIDKYHHHVTPFDSYTLQLVLDRMVKEAGVHTLLYTRFADSVTGNGKISHIILDAPQGLIAIKAKVYIDCTGNADVAAASGVPTWFGTEDGQSPQPATLFFEVDGAEDDAYLARPERPVKCYRKPLPGSYKVNHYRVAGVNANDADSMTAGTMQGREQVLDAYNVLLKTPGFENSKITAVASMLGCRESRHVKGHYLLSVKDLAEGTAFEDTVCLYGYGMDIHPRDGVENGNFKIEVANVYQVPYRSLVPLQCDNLLVAGRAISCESQAAGAIRVMPCCMAMGQAAGCAAATAARDSIAPIDVDTAALRATLKAHGAIL